MANLVLRPNSDISTNSYSKEPSSQANYYSLVNEANHDGDTTYFYTTSTSAVLVLGSELPNKNSNIINQITLHAICANERSGGFNTQNSGTIGFVLNGSTHTRAVTINGTSYQDYTYSYTPDSTLTFQDLSDLRFQFGSFSDNGNKLYAKCTQLYFDISYTEATVSDYHSILVNAVHITHNLPSQVENGTPLSGTFIPEIGYQLPTSIQVQVGGQTTSSFTYNNQTGLFYMENVSGDIIITVVAEEIMYAVDLNLVYTSSQGISSTVSYNGSIAGTFSAELGYALPTSIEVKIDDEILDASQYSYNADNGSFELTEITGDVTITIISSVIRFTITTIAHTGGTITPSSEVEYGGSLNIIIIPNDEYTIAEVKVDDTSIGTPSSYLFQNVTSNHVIEAFFSLIPILPSTGIIARISNNYDFYIKGRFVEGQSFSFDKYGNLTLNEIKEGTSAFSLQDDLTLYCNEIKEEVDFGTN